MTRGGTVTEELLAAVTEPTRRQMLDLLLERGEATATALADSLPVTRQAVTKHLAVLSRVGLVDGGQKSGREVRYRLNLELLDRTNQSLGELAATWDRRLLRIKQIAEAASQAQGRPGNLGP